MTRSADTEHRYRRLGPMAPPEGFPEFVDASVGPDGRAVALWSTTADHDDLVARAELDDGAPSPTSRTSTAPPIALGVYTPSVSRPEDIVVVPNPPVPRPLVQPLVDGEFILVGARCRWPSTGPEHNAVVVDASGAIVRTGTLGDGIEHLLADGEGSLWVGYSDEGIFGNPDWWGPGRRPLGAAGIVKWSATFDVLWEYSPPRTDPKNRHRGEDADGYRPADCYTLNVSTRENGTTRVRACTYERFPLITITDRAGSTTVTVEPTTGPRGPSSVLASDEHVAFLGSHRDHESLLIGRLDALTTFSAARLRLPGDGTHGTIRRVCRGGTAHLFLHNDWYVLDLAEPRHHRGC
ncbi:MAG: hypothetical protein QM809_08940 [Gordonia sp. (in: high G+C Gram-positive bacteria)]|uniref:hypothetical protein n=1 Tax=Gordonia sp. (in: high G+C Gram-positive bacteria) TaxID=84139 RepID=UPI0039E33953